MIMKLTRKQIIRIIIIVIVAFGVYKCDIPLNIKPGEVTLTSRENVLKRERSLWIYKPVSDTFLLQDSLRNILYKFKDVFVYDSRYIRNIHIHMFAPWAIVNYSSNNKFVTVTTDYLELQDKENRRLGISYSITKNPTSNNLLDYPYAWPTDDSIKHRSYIGATIKSPIPDTLYMILWGRRDLYLPYSIYEKLPDSTQRYMGYYKTGYEDQVKLGIVKFVLSDSIINEHAPKGIKRKLIIPWITKI